MEKFMLFLDIKVNGSKFVPVEAGNLIKAVHKAYEEHDIAQRNILTVIRLEPEPVVITPAKLRKKSSKL